MNRVVQAGVTIGTGFAAYGLMGLGVENMILNSEERNERVAACAEQLGEMAVQEDVLPANCQYFHDNRKPENPAMFEYETTTVTNSDGEIVSEHTIFELPTAAEFRTEHLWTPAEIKERDDSLEIVKVVTAGVTAFIVFSTTQSIRGIKRREQERQAAAAETPQSYTLN